MTARHAVVTGASKGIGAALTRELVGRGYRVTTVARSQAVLERQAAELGTLPITLDLADLDACAGLVDRVERDHGEIDVWVNNAAHPGAGALADVSAETLRAALTVNLLAPMELTRQIAARMTTRDRGSIVAVSSVAGELALRNMSLYGVPKAGTTHMTGYLQRELRRTGVHVMLVFLGEVAGTDLVKDACAADPQVAKVVERFAALPSLTPEAVAANVADGIEQRRPRVIMPKFVAPLFYLRRAPSLLTDALIPRPEGTPS